MCLMIKQDGQKESIIMMKISKQKNDQTWHIIALKDSQVLHAVETNKVDEEATVKK